MKVREVMTTDVASIQANATVTEAAQLMQKHNIGAIPVVDNNRVVGIVTDRDIVVRNVAHGKSPMNTAVQHIMTSQVTSVSPDADISEIDAKMGSEQIRRIPVIENDRLVGIVSLGDLATTGFTKMEASEALTEISKPSRPQKG